MKSRALLISFLVLSISLIGCKGTMTKTTKEGQGSKIIGTWKLVYGDIKTGDSVEIKDLSNTTFIKILNEGHFAFFNQVDNTSDGFYGGGGSYVFDGSTHKETLEYTSLQEIRGHEFTFEVEFKGDTLIQKGLEDVPEIGLKRYITEKYIKID